MKKLMFLMMALLVAPAMAGVTITLVEVEGECAVDLVVTADGTDADAGKSLVAGIAITLSVGAGEEITSVVPTVEGESTAGNLGYGIFIGTMTFTGGDPEEIATFGTPVAPGTAPDAPGQLPGESCVLELAALYDVAVPGDAPDAVTTLCRINLAGDAIITLTEEIATRGGIVLIGGGAPSGVVLPAPTQVTCAPCLGDGTGDGQINGADVGGLIATFGKVKGQDGYLGVYDFNFDDAVNGADIGGFLGVFGTICPE